MRKRAKFRFYTPTQINIDKEGIIVTSHFLFLFTLLSFEVSILCKRLHKAKSLKFRLNFISLKSENGKARHFNNL